MSFREQVKKLAYELYDKNGRREGRDLLDWLAAEQIIRFQQKIFAGMGDGRIGLLEHKPLSGGEEPGNPEGPKSRTTRKPGAGRHVATGGRR
ncbi:MAG: DUF2934 domain-containing protein [Deltaproteobacteria bacterium]|nr:DUF2934 domain-containing protein [Deltaproteobacteria bacterium]